MKELHEVVEKRRVSDSDGSGIDLWRGCVEADLWVLTAKWKKYGRKTFLCELKGDWDMQCR